MHKYFVAIGLFLCIGATAQLPEDALRASWTTPGGTAREQAIGGAMGSIGGDITAAFVNPAGLAFFKTNEFVISPGWRLYSNKGSYLGTSQTASSINRFSMGASGIIISLPSTNPGTNNTLTIAVNQTANFNSHIAYQGTNTNSSFAEQLSQEFAGSGLDIRDIDGGIASPSLDYATRMALYSYLIDTATVNGSLQVVAQPTKSGRLLQQNNMLSKGGITEINISLANNQHDKWYFGIGVGIPILNYTRYQTYTETDVSGNPNNDFQSFSYREKYWTSGAGFNARAGLIFSPTPAWRIGLAVHTPSELALTDRISASMITQTENYIPNLKTVAISSDSLDELTGLSPRPNSTTYRLITPWHFLLSGSYLFGGGQANIKNQKGFITADLEYITTHSPHFSVPTDDDGNPTSDYDYGPVNQVIKAAYKGTLSARLGGEMKFDTWLVRAGAAYYGNPYSQSGLKADRLYFSGGLGYRVKAFFADLSYVMGFNRNIDVPYRLADKDNSYASLKETGGTLLMTVGVKW